MIRFFLAVVFCVSSLSSLVPLSTTTEFPGRRFARPGTLSQVSSLGGVLNTRNDAPAKMELRENKQFSGVP